MPQNVLYVLSNDVLSPVCFGVLFLCVLQWLRAESPSLLLGAMTGLAIAASYLTKLSNLPLLTVALIAIVAKWLQMLRQQSGVASVASILTILCDLISAVTLCRDGRNTTAQHAINVPAAGALPRCSHSRRSARLSCAAFRPVRFW